MIFARGTWRDPALRLTCFGGDSGGGGEGGSGGGTTSAASDYSDAVNTDPSMAMGYPSHDGGAFGGPGAGFGGADAGGGDPSQAYAAISDRGHFDTPFTGITTPTAPDMHGYGYQMAPTGISQGTDNYTGFGIGDPGNFGFSFGPASDAAQGGGGVSAGLGIGGAAADAAAGVGGGRGGHPGVSPGAISGPEAAPGESVGVSWGPGGMDAARGGVDASAQGGNSSPFEQWTEQWHDAPRNFDTNNPFGFGQGPEMPAYAASLEQAFGPGVTPAAVRAANPHVQDDESAGAFVGWLRRGVSGTPDLHEAAFRAGGGDPNAVIDPLTRSLTGLGIGPRMSFDDANSEYSIHSGMPLLDGANQSMRNYGLPGYRVGSGGDAQQYDWGQPQRIPDSWRSYQGPIDMNTPAGGRAPGFDQLQGLPMVPDEMQFGGVNPISPNMIPDQGQQLMGNANQLLAGLLRKVG